MDCTCRVLYQLLTSEKLIKIFSKSNLLVKPQFQIMGLGIEQQ